MLTSESVLIIKFKVGITKLATLIVATWIVSSGYSSESAILSAHKLISYSIEHTPMLRSS